MGNARRDLCRAGNRDNARDDICTIDRCTRGAPRTQPLWSNVVPKLPNARGSAASQSQASQSAATTGRIIRRWLDCLGLTIERHDRHHRGFRARTVCVRRCVTITGPTNDDERAIWMCVYVYIVHCPTHIFGLRASVWISARRGDSLNERRRSDSEHPVYIVYNTDVLESIRTMVRSSRFHLVNTHIHVIEWINFLDYT